MKARGDAGFQLTLAEGGAAGTGGSCWSCCWGCRAVLGKGGDPRALEERGNRRCLPTGCTALGRQEPQGC